MCEDCEARGEEVAQHIWNGLVDLVTESGELSDEIDNRTRELREQFADDPEALDRIERAKFGVRCELIATAAAQFASIKGGSVEGMPPSMILGTWAGDLMQAEVVGQRITETLAGIFSTITDN